jgi:hypothetical protein
MRHGSEVQETDTIVERTASSCRLYVAGSGGRLTFMIEASKLGAATPTLQGEPSMYNKKLIL